MNLRWRWVERTEQSPAGWYAEIAPGVELVRLEVNETMERLRLHIDGLQIPYFRADIPVQLREQRINHIVASLRRAGAAWGRLAEAQEPLPAEEGRQASLFGDDR